MVAPAAGLIAVQTAHSSMEGMDGSDPAEQAHLPTWWTEIVHLGPGILVVSVLLVALAVALRRRFAALPAVAGGLTLYLGMYAQPSLPVMDAAMVLGITSVVLAYMIGIRPALRLATARSNH